MPFKFTENRQPREHTGTIDCSSINNSALPSGKPLVGFGKSKLAGIGYGLLLHGNIRKGEGSTRWLVSRLNSNAGRSHRVIIEKQIARSSFFLGSPRQDQWADGRSDQKPLLCGIQVNGGVAFGNPLCTW